MSNVALPYNAFDIFFIIIDRKKGMVTSMRIKYFLYSCVLVF